MKMNDDEKMLMLGEMKQSISMVQKQVSEIFTLLNQLTREGLPQCAVEHKRIDRVEMGLVRLLLAMLGSGVLGGAASEILKGLIK